ncbi:MULTISPECIES: hypothetical protein [unclassified Streptomyces]|uniref:hypothetical protein n=1 Tax=unclassified Streptomyces TaxID=2593676 RepID=UPI0033A71DD2
MFGRKNKASSAPTADDIREAGRQLQQGGVLGRGSKRHADKIVKQAEAAGLDGRDVAFQILGAAAEHEPKRGRR